MIDSISSAANASADLKRTRRRKVGTKADVDRLPPHALECEVCILGCVLISPPCLQTVIEAFKGRTDVFYDLRHQTIFEALISLRKAGQPIDVITLQRWLKDDALLEQVGGVAYLDSLQDKVPSAANLSYYLDKVQEKYLLRKIVHTCTDVVGRVYDFEGNVDFLLDAARRDLEKVFSHRERSGRFYSVDDLDAFNPDLDANNRIGNRWLCKGGKLIIPSASGAGKSSLVMQMLTLFALGKDFCGIMPHGPQNASSFSGALSSIMVGDENDIGDLSEMFQGTREFLKLNSFEHDEAFSTLRKNLKFWHCPALSGEKFLAAIEAELKRDPRDICCIDPLVSFAGVDLTKQDQSAKFLREGLTRIAEETGVIWFVVHHTPKPQVNPGKRQFAKKTSEYQYAGAGSFDLPGWARAVMTLDEATDGVFRLVLAKRGRRAGATHLDGTQTTMLWMRHAEKGIHWEQADPPSEPEESHQPKEKKLTIPEQVAGFNLGTFLSSCQTAGESKRTIMSRLKSWLGSKDSPKKSLGAASHGTLNNCVNVLLDREFIAVKEDLYFKGINA